MLHMALATAAASLLTFAAFAAEPAEPAGDSRKASNCFALARGMAAPEQIMPAALGGGSGFPPAPAPDHVRIHYLNHAEFLIQAGALNAVTDYTGLLGAGDAVPDVVTMNNAHDTHWTATPDPRIPHVLRGWPQQGTAARYDLDLGAMLVRNVTTDTRGPFGEGALRDGNSIFIFEAGGLCIGHLGHLHQVPDDAQYAAIGRLDVVMVPVDGGYTLDMDSMVGIVQRLRARVVIPMHWFTDDTLARFLASMAQHYDVVETGGPDIELSQADLPATPTVLVLTPELLP